MIPVYKLGVAVCRSNPRAEEVKTGGSPGFAAIAKPVSSGSARDGVSITKMGVGDDN